MKINKLFTLILGVLFSTIHCYDMRTRTHITNEEHVTEKVSIDELQQLVKDHSLLMNSLYRTTLQLREDFYNQKMVLSNGTKQDREKQQGYIERAKLTKRDPKLTKANLMGPISDDQQDIFDDLQEYTEDIQAGRHAERPRGILLVGSPGTGKSYFTETFAGENGYLLFKQDASDINTGFAGDGAAYVKASFNYYRQEADKHATQPKNEGKLTIVFIDEVDAVARCRGDMGEGSASTNTRATLNQLLVEMDEYEKNKNILFVFATNREGDLDPAFKRPGRADRTVYFKPPTKEQLIKKATELAPGYRRCDGAIQVMEKKQKDGSDLFDIMVNHKFTFPYVKVVLARANCYARRAKLSKAQWEHYKEAIEYAVIKKTGDERRGYPRERSELVQDLAVISQIKNNLPTEDEKTAIAHLKTIGCTNSFLINE